MPSRAFWGQTSLSHRNQGRFDAKRAEIAEDRRKRCPICFVAIHANQIGAAKLIPDNLKLGVPRLIQPLELWHRESGELIFLEGTRFAKRESKFRIEWITRIRMCAAFRRVALGNQPVFPPSVIRDTRFDIYWSADVKGDKFSNGAVGEIKLVSNERTTDSAFTRMQLGLPVPESSVLYNVTTQNPSTNVAVPSGAAPLFFNERPAG